MNFKLSVSSSPYSLPDFSVSFQTTATPSQRELICHHFHQHGCSTRACMGPWFHPWLFFFLGTWVPSLAVFLTSTCSVFFCSPPGWLLLCSFLRSPAAIGFTFPCTRCRLLLLHVSFEPILGFDSHASPALVGFFGAAVGDIVSEVVQPCKASGESSDVIGTSVCLWN